MDAKQLRDRIEDLREVRPDPRDALAMARWKGHEQALDEVLRLIAREVA